MDKEKFRNADLKIRELVKLVTVDSDIKLIREDLCESAKCENTKNYDELLLKYATELIDAANDKPKKSEMVCNCCGECAEEIDAMKEMNRAVDMFINAANKLANKQKF